MESCGIGGAKLAWLYCNPLHAVASSSSSSSSMRCGLCRLGGGSPRRQRALIFVAESVYGLGAVGSVPVLGRERGRARLGEFCHSVRRALRNSVLLTDSEIGSMQKKGIAIEVNRCVLEPTGLNGFHGFDGVNSSSGLNGAIGEDAQGSEEDFRSRELVLSSQVALSKRPVNRRKVETEEEREPVAVWPQVPGKPERWWRIPDFIHEVLPLHRSFNLQLEILFDKLGCRIHSRELLLRILVHKSYYLSKMPQSIRERKLRKPLMSWQRSDIMDDDNLMTFADAHGEARSQLALVGDTVLNLAASLYLIRQHPLLSNGLITERRSQLVCNSNLARAWSSLLNLRELVLCDPPLSQSKKPSATAVLELQMKACADTLEAYIGGLYVEKGLESALQCVETRLLPFLLLAEPIRNPVALLHERCVIILQEKPDYKLIGIDNKNTPNEMCRIRVYVKGLRMSTGIGKSQKLARRDAAEKALLKWPEVFGATS